MFHRACLLCFRAVALVFCNLLQPALFFRASATWWRLVSDQYFPNGWHACAIRFCVDTNCSFPVAVPVQEHLWSMPATIATVGSAGVLYNEFKYSCGVCGAGHIFIAAKFNQDTPVQCVSLENCQTGGRRLSATTSTEMSASNDMSSIDIGLRRLQTWADHFPASLRLDHSQDGSTWTRVASWDYHSSMENISHLKPSNAAVIYPDQALPIVVSRSPSGVASCATCLTAINGVSATSAVQVTFNEAVFTGSGSIRLTRGGLSSLNIPVTSSSWIHVSGTSLRITPQDLLAGSSGCADFTFPWGAVVDIHSKSSPIFSHKICIADTLAPALHSSDPSIGGVNVDCNAPLLLSFNEAVQVRTGYANVHVIKGHGASPNIDIDLAAASIYTWNANTKAMTVRLQPPFPFAPNTTYELTVPGGVQDRSGNTWSGSAIPFTTSSSCTIGGISVGLGSSGNTKSSRSDPAIPLYGFIIIGVFAFLLFSFLALVWRRHSQKASKVSTLQAQVHGKMFLQPLPSVDIEKCPSAKRCEPQTHTLGPPLLTSPTPPQEPIKEFKAESPIIDTSLRDTARVEMLPLKKRPTQKNIESSSTAELGILDAAQADSPATKSRPTQKQFHSSRTEDVGLHDASPIEASPPRKRPARNQLESRTVDMSLLGAVGSESKSPPKRPIHKKGESLCAEQLQQATEKHLKTQLPASTGTRGKTKSKEAEDVPVGLARKPPPFNSKERRKRRDVAFTEDTADGAGWVKKVDPNTGYTYYYHRQTLESRWTKPELDPSTATGAATAARTDEGFFKRSSTQLQEGPPRPNTSVDQTLIREKTHDFNVDIAPAIKNLEEAEEIARVKDDVRMQLDRTRHEDAASRRKTFKFLCLRWHPDKNTENSALATAVFKFLQYQRDWYLKDA